ncbi:TVP38/TMEM64 family protein [Tropicimonas marinistellae]|uniref:TVP38/TMEM64 family protein n=1 Tax=Tropicimonas marinistellae TaxID=1739787 RepID=UPI00082970E7|nr:TVP38/TMEM64 family protein [Tropicimonas marinistellae]
MSDMTPPRRPGAIRILPFAAIMLVAVVGALALRDVLGVDTLAQYRDTILAYRDANLAATLAVFLLAYVAIVAFSLPGATVATLTGGFLFGVFPGVLVNMVAATLGAALIFLAARWGMGEALARRMDASDGQVKRIKAGIDANQWEMLFLVRLIPLVPFFVANLVPALVGVPLGRFVVTTFLGILPGALVYTSVGAGLGEVLAAGERPDLGVIFEPHILLPLLGLAALAALPMVLKSRRGGRAS